MPIINFYFINAFETSELSTTDRCTDGQMDRCTDGQINGYNLIDGEYSFGAP